MNIDQIRAHIDALIKEKNKNYRSLSLAIGKNEAYLHQFINKGSPLRLPESERRKLAELLDVEEQELTDIILPKSTYNTDPKSSALIELISLAPTKNFEAKTSGYLSIPLSDFSNFSSAPAQTTKMFRITGDSMFPTLKDGDYVFLDTSVNSLTSDGLYLIELPNGWHVRRLQQISSSECAVILDNAKYQSTTCSLKKLKIIGKISFAFKTEKLI